VVRVNFTPGDLARTRFTMAQAPLSDTMLAFIELRRAANAGWRGTGQAGQWLRQARRAFPVTARPLFDLLGPRGPWSALFDEFAPDLHAGLEELRATPRAILRAQVSSTWSDQGGRPPLWVRNLADGYREEFELVIRALHDLHDAVVAPRWDSAVAVFHADVARRIPVLVTGGHEALFGTLHPKLRWQDGGLEREGLTCKSGLGGHGLLIRPSAFWTGEPIFALDETGHRPNVMVYAARPSGEPDGRDGTAVGSAAPDGLAALLGSTRAAVLRALGEPLGTAELAAAVGISPASASEHSKVLRDASLIETRRLGRAVRHSLTPLGAMMVGQLPPPASSGMACG
jgi:DNA-binding transcriptional ArsR family regulator